MENSVIEASYPISFRKENAKILAEHLKNRHSVVLVGMKRVGISNFLRFFLHHEGIAQTYIADSKKHLFIPVDLNDLVERDVYPFWTLTLKRIADAVSESGLPQGLKREIESLFLESIQTQDLFFTTDSVSRALVKIVDAGFLPTIFFIRFDRMKDAATPAFFDNLNGLRDAARQKLSYVFTSFKTLDKLSPDVFKKASLSVFAQNIYIKPADTPDTKIIYDTYKDKYSLSLSLALKEALFKIVDGYVQYLQLSLILLRSIGEKIKTEEELYNLLVKDEGIMLQSEELWASLDNEEKNILGKIIKDQDISEKDKKDAAYLWDTGIILDKYKGIEIFSPLFEGYIRKLDMDKRNGEGLDFSKKENLLFVLLKDNLNKICEREGIIESVWPEVEALGVSDWAIDRLIARLRGKLRLRKSEFEIQTIKTRGYKLIPR